MTERVPDPDRRRGWWTWPRAALAAGTVVAVVAATLAGTRILPETTVVLDGADTGAEPAPGFALPSLADDRVVIDLADYRGTPVVLNFWASWCVPCRREMPAFEAVHQQVGDEVAFVGVNHQDDRDAALRLVDETGVTYPSAYDPQGVVAYDYAVRGMPTTVFITADGLVAAHHTGELTQTDLRAALDELTDR